MKQCNGVELFLQFLTWLFLVNFLEMVRNFFQHFDHPYALSAGLRIHQLQSGKTLPFSTKLGIQGMTLNCIWGWGFSFGDLGSVVLLGPLKFGLVVTVRVRSKSRKDLFENYSYSIGMYKKY